MGVITLFMMVLMHVIEDFHLQGIMAKMKQKDWWDRQFIDETDRLEGKISDEGLDNYYKNMFKMYHNDYVPVLILHGFEWAMFIHIPILVSVYMTDPGLLSETWFEMCIVASVLFNTSIHALVDDYKANRFRINLVQDQLIHIIQIVVTYVAFEVIA